MQPTHNVRVPFWLVLSIYKSGTKEKERESGKESLEYLNLKVIYTHEKRSWSSTMFIFFTTIDICHFPILSANNSLIKKRILIYRYI